MVVYQLHADIINSPEGVVTGQRCANSHTSVLYVIGPDTEPLRVVSARQQQEESPSVPEKHEDHPTHVLDEREQMDYSNAKAIIAHTYS